MTIRILCLSAIALAAATAMPAWAVGGEDVDKSGTPASTFDLALQLYVGGIPLGKVGISGRVQGKEYHASSTLETLGIVNAFWQSKIETAANGTLGPGTLHPTLYDSFSQNRRDQRRQVTLSYKPGGEVTVQADPPYPATSNMVSQEEQKRAVDPLSGAVLLIAAAAAEAKTPCTATAPIFDGRRRYDIGVGLVRTIAIKMDNGLYSGPGMMCQIRYAQIAGYQQTVVDSKKKLPPIYVWVAPIKSRTDPSREFMLPLRIWAETEFGVVVALATEAHVDGAALSSPMR